MEVRACSEFVGRRRWGFAVIVSGYARGSWNASAPTMCGITCDGNHLRPRPLPSPHGEDSAWAKRFRIGECLRLVYLYRPIAIFFIFLANRMSLDTSLCICFRAMQFCLHPSVRGATLLTNLPWKQSIHA